MKRPMTAVQTLPSRPRAAPSDKRLHPLAGAHGIRGQRRIMSDFIVGRYCSELKSCTDKRRDLQSPFQSSQSTGTTKQSHINIRLLTEVGTCGKTELPEITSRNHRDLGGAQHGDSTARTLNGIVARRARERLWRLCHKDDDRVCVTRTARSAARPCRALAPYRTGRHRGNICRPSGSPLVCRDRLSTDPLSARLAVTQAAEQSHVWLDGWTQPRSWNRP